MCHLLWIVVHFSYSHSTMFEYLFEWHIIPIVLLQPRELLFDDFWICLYFVWERCPLCMCACIFMRKSTHSMNDYSMESERLEICISPFFCLLRSIPPDIELISHDEIALLFKRLWFGYGYKWWNPSRFVLFE